MTFTVVVLPIWVRRKFWKSDSSRAGSEPVPVMPRGASHALLAELRRGTLCEKPYNGTLFGSWQTLQDRTLLWAFSSQFPWKLDLMSPEKDLTERVGCLVSSSEDSRNGLAWVALNNISHKLKVLFHRNELTIVFELVIGCIECGILNWIIHNFAPGCCFPLTNQSVPLTAVMSFTK